MPLTFDQVSKIVSIIDNSSCEELIVETDDIKLVVRRRVSGTPLPRERPEHPTPVAAVSETTPATTFAAPKTSPKPAAVGAVDGFSRVSVDAPGSGLIVDLRKRPADPSTSVCHGGKALNDDGTAALLVEDDSLEGAAVFLVLLGSDAHVLSQRPTRVGGEA